MATEDAALANLQDELEEKGRIIGEKDEELQEKDRIINEITRELQGRNEEIEKVVNEKTRELQGKNEELQEKDRIIGEKTRELQRKNEELRTKTHEIRRKDILLQQREWDKRCLFATLCLTVVVVAVCVAIIVQQYWNVTQLQSSVAEKVQIITWLERSLVEKALNISHLQRSLEEMEQKATQLQSSLEEKEQIITRLQSSLFAVSNTCRVSGPGLSATANYPTHVIVELSDASGQPCSLRQNVTAELQSVDQSSVVPTTVSIKSPSQYEVSYTASSRGQHKLYVRFNDSEVGGSPFNITVYPDPTQLEKPVRVVTGLNKPWGIAVNSHGEIVMSNYWGRTISLLYNRAGIQTLTQLGMVKPVRDGTSGHILHRKIVSEGDRPEQMRYPTGVAVDSDDNVYVASEHKLQKFSRDGRLIKCVGHEGSEDGEFRQPKGVRLHHGHVYVCDFGNNRIQVFDTDLNFIRTIGSHGLGREQFIWPYELDFDSEGKAYISDEQNYQIQVIDTSGQFVRQFGQDKGEGKLKRPTAVHVMGQFVYVSDQGHDRIVVYQTSGQFVTSFENRGEEERDFTGPYGITSDQNGFVYVTDITNSRVQVF